MLKAFTLLLPALIPSWRFFQDIAPSPRIECARLQSPHDEAALWHEFRPRPARVSFAEMVKRLIWNPHWNERLFLMSCAERLVQNPTDHSMEEIAQRLRADLGPDGYFQFRLVFVSREEDVLEPHVILVSPVYNAAEMT